MRAGFAGDLVSFLDALAAAAGLEADPAPVAAALLAELAWLEGADGDRLPEGRTARLVLFAWLCLHRIGMLAGEGELAEHAEELAGRFGLARPLEEMLYGEATEDDDPLAALDVPALMTLFNLLLRWQLLLADPARDTEDICRALFADQGASTFVGRHESGGCEWFAKERWELLVEWLALATLLDVAGENAAGSVAEGLREGLRATAAVLVARAEDAGYRVAGMIGDGEEPLREGEPEPG
jgi:hypothetical protein